MTFEDMLNMFSVFSEAAPIGVKAKYAFRIYDKRGLGLDKKDVRDMIEKLLGGKKLEDADRDLLVEKVGQDEPISSNCIFFQDKFVSLNRYSTRLTQTEVKRLHMMSSAKSC